MIFVLSFNSSHEAISAEEALENLYSSRLIPLHPSISAGCGLALRLDVDDKAQLLRVLSELKVIFDKAYIKNALGKYEVV